MDRNSRFDRIARDLRDAGVDLVTWEHVRLWREEIIQYAVKWVDREKAVREGKHRKRLACPYFLRLFSSNPTELIGRGRHDPGYDVCTRTGGIIERPEVH